MSKNKPLTREEIVARAKAKEKAKQQAHQNKRISNIIGVLTAQGARLTDKFLEDRDCMTIEMTSSMFQNEIHRGNLSMYFRPSVSQEDFHLRIEGYLEFSHTRYAIWVDPDSTVGIQSVLGLNKTHM